jgi:hypothetical protein
LLEKCGEIKMEKIKANLLILLITLNVICTLHANTIDDNSFYRPLNLKNGNYIATNIKQATTIQFDNGFNSGICRNSFN